jgi:hypothetical protein
MRKRRKKSDLKKGWLNHEIHEIHENECDKKQAVHTQPFFVVATGPSGGEASAPFAPLRG